MAHEVLTARTDAKLRYAKLHLAELLERDVAIRGDDYERAHVEAFAAQLLGAYMALLHELNEDLRCEIPAENLTLGKMRGVLRSQNRMHSKLTELYDLGQDQTSWFAKVKEIRDLTTHIHSLPLAYTHDDNGGVTNLRHPKTHTDIEGEVTEVLQGWIEQMASLVFKHVNYGT